MSFHRRGRFTFWAMVVLVVVAVVVKLAGVW